jgi:hypothetical protein
MRTNKPELTSEGPTQFSGPSGEEIAQRAYQLWEERGKPHGSPEEDWHRAAHQLRQSSGALDEVPAAPKETAE